MKERPIIFNTEMVQAILDGRKTQTRRVVSSKYLFNKDPGRYFVNTVGYLNTDCPGVEVDGYYCQFAEGEKENPNYFGPIKSPYGQPSDLLYVRETWCDHNNEVFYKADNIGWKPNYTKIDDLTFLGWKPSIHMPKKHARIWLKIKDVRVERLQDISYTDAIGVDISWAANPWVWVVEFERHNK